MTRFQSPSHFLLLLFLCFIALAASNEQQYVDSAVGVDDSSNIEPNDSREKCKEDSDGCVNSSVMEEEEDEETLEDADNEEEEEEEDEYDEEEDDEEEYDEDGDYDDEEYDDEEEYDDDEDDDEDDEEEYDEEEQEEEYVHYTDKHWTEYNQDDLRIKFQCAEVFSTARPVPTAASWEYMRETYRIVVGDKSTIPNERASKSAGFPGLEVVARQSPGKGRGVFSAQFIPKGTLVWSSIYTARFPDGNSYRQYLLSLSPDLACEVLPWAYVEPVLNKEDADKEDGDNNKLKYEDLPLYISLDLTIGSLINAAPLYDKDAGFDDRTQYEYEGRLIPREWEGYANAGCIPNDSEIGCDGHNDYALRHIYPGEEILMNYDAFSFPDYWGEVGLVCNSCGKNEDDELRDA
jgi:hypothetical protein